MFLGVDVLGGFYFFCKGFKVLFLFFEDYVDSVKVIV